jgi:prevent-host-death family protein
MKIAADQFKAQCFELIDQIQQTKKEVVITKHGIPVARLMPIEAASKDSIIGWMKGSVVTTADIVVPLEESWEVDIS